ncbi:cytochrome-c peroxidase [Cryomorpha ignava]|uniref:Cytochrome-c peroxidase n=1 Tax=Cryomorpha ignava TaxID=101383 RepID=A0A7K3WRM0_9FLAO|nr:cytochrome c peroxidase [Cryomorpha ignava]NEN24166.1 cytochrome-c peroxidase [Cryomorpha ignava]
MQFKTNKGGVILLIAVVVISALLSSFNFTTDKRLVDQYSNNLDKSFLQLKRTAAQYRVGQSTEAKLVKAINEARNEYKRVEFILNYYYPDYTESNLNGAPLFHISREGSRASVHPPEGLQYLDELIYDNPGKHAIEIDQLAGNLQNAFAKVKSDLDSKSIPEGELISAMRQELIAIVTLGITGFDTPGSLRGIEESKYALFSLKTFSTDYFEEDSKEIVQRLQGAMAYLDKNSDFETFDRLVFIREHIDPTYALLRDLAFDRDILLQENHGAWNQNSSSIFAKDFLDPYYFTELTRKDDSPEIKLLGKKLFYDASLSTSGSLSCGSCHKPELAFTDGAAKSVSNVEGKTVQRNAPTLLNAVYADRYFYDLRAFTLEQQAEHVIFNEEEFDSAYSQIIESLKADKTYKSLFKTAFKSADLTRERLIRSLTSYVLSLQSFNSPFDKYMRKESELLSAEAKNGFNLFMGKAACGTCHFAPTFSGLVPPHFQKTESEILGVMQKPNQKVIDPDNGRNNNGINNEEAWIYNKSFKTVTVRNIELTAPYFHNGAYGTLNEVIEFYENGGAYGVGFSESDLPNQTLSGDHLNLTESEKKNIITFLKSLTDNTAATY